MEGTSNTEIEVKVALIEWRDYDKLLRSLTTPEANFTQFNSYLDDDARSLRNARIMLRAREIKFPVGAAKGLGKPPVTITAKRRRSSEGGIFISDEHEQVMAYDDWTDFVIGREPLPMTGHVFKWVKNQVEHGDLKVLGQTKNERFKVRSDMFVLEIDITKFPDDSTEVEIECETIWPDVAKKHIEDLCAKLGIKTRPQTLGKFARFLQKTEGIRDYPG
jgi:uncharacterized protein YjbK